MRVFKRTGPAITVRLSDYEVTLLESLVDQFCGLLEAEVPEAPDPDPFARWQAELDGGDELDRSDPAILRLFPDAYPDDPIASAEFRRLTQSRQRADRLAQAEIVVTALQDTEAGKHPLQVRLVDLPSWLKTLTAVRLSLAARLGIRTSDDTEELDDLPDTDPRAYLYRVYEWIAYLTENLIGLA